MDSGIKTLLEREIAGIKGKVTRILLITLGAVLMAIKVKTFVRVGNLIPVGITGISHLLKNSVFMCIKVKFT